MTRLSAPVLGGALAAALLAGGCGSAQTQSTASAPGAASPAAPSKEKEEEARQKALKRAGLERERPIAEAKLAKARKEQGDQESANQVALDKAKKEHDLALGRLRDFEEKEDPQRRARARLDMQQARDMLDEAKEELEQLEMMYKGQDLADMTKEVVIRRGKRRVERATQRLALQEQEVQRLEQNTLPLERAKLSAEAEAKAQDLDRARRAAETASLERKIDLMGSEAEIVRIKMEIEALEAGAKKEGAAP
jgi:hypothetical protein